MLTRKMSSKSMHAFLSNLADRRTDRETSWAIAFTSSVVRGNYTLPAATESTLMLPYDNLISKHRVYANIDANLGVLF